MIKGNIYLLTYFIIINFILCTNIQSISSKTKNVPLLPFFFTLPYTKRIKRSALQSKRDCTFFTGIKPSGNIHLGNYIGCLHPIINVEATKKCSNNLSNKNESVIKLNKIILIADLHCLTKLSNIYSLKDKVTDSVKIIMSLIIDMYKKKQSYLDVYINNVKLEDILQLIENKEPNKSNPNNDNNNNYNNNYNNNNNLYEEIASYTSEFHNHIKTDNLGDDMNCVEFPSQECHDHKSKPIKQKHYFYIFKQSDIKLHTSLYYLINSFTSINMLNSHIHIKMGGQNKSVALFSYPSLMLADILLYKPTYLIIGQDQIKNMEIMKKLCRKINYHFSNVAKLPKIFFSKFYSEVMNLDGHKKMSKNHLLHHDKDTSKIIYLLDNKKTIENKIKKSKTDNYNILIYGQEDRKEINNLINIFFFFYYHQIKNKRYINRTFNNNENGNNENGNNENGNNENGNNENGNNENGNNENGNNENDNNKNDKNQNDKNQNDNYQNDKNQNQNLNISKLSYIYDEHQLFRNIQYAHNYLNDFTNNPNFSHYKQNNINPHFNQNIINKILQSYNNNYSKFKYDLSELIYNHFVTTKMYYNSFNSRHDIIHTILQNGKKCVHRRASQMYKVIKKKLNI
ncbi:tryptophan--tRNA ligase, putative [Plasmodium reichenowi]|uniref:Tryptophan--tRNA ligase, putative n=1 Tax=Plasmodium reichenowi TaxID=5854 RepID=A0A151L9T1_PLARE|nr:tryptophan--tRNA ligase, putative [Plasmodium reichenowi]KYN95616.1 tryptophan--tRNA ligase, putative [Plasmodium reichenowi]